MFKKSKKTAIKKNDFKASKLTSKELRNVVGGTNTTTTQTTTQISIPNMDGASKDKPE